MTDKGWIVIGVGAGAGAYLLYVASRPGVGGLSGLISGVAGSLGLSSSPGLTAAQRAAFAGGFTDRTPVSGALTGAAAGAPLAVPTFGIAPAIGALIGYFAVKGSNETKQDREAFATRLGFRQLGGEVDGLDQTVTALTGRNSLYGYLDFIGRHDLTDYAMHVIGRQDFTGNVAWMSSVLDALQTVRFPFPGV